MALTTFEIQCFKDNVPEGGYLYYQGQMFRIEGFEGSDIIGRPLCEENKCLIIEDHLIPLESLMNDTDCMVFKEPVCLSDLFTILD